MPFSFAFLPFSSNRPPSFLLLLPLLLLLRRLTQRTVFIKSIRDQRTLELSFPFPDEADFYASKPGAFLSHLIGHEGKGSILSHLKEKGWANGMSAGNGNGAHGFEFFKIQVDLTAEGLGAFSPSLSVSFPARFHLVELSSGVDRKGEN